MRRREVLALLGGTALWPLGARAQKMEMPVVGFLHALAFDAKASPWVDFNQGLKEAGYAEGQNVAIEYRLAVGPQDRLIALADELAARKVNVMVAAGSAISVAAKAATSTIPVVFVGGSDPVKLGLVQSLSRPGGHMTGVTRQSHGLAAKQLELLAELVPRATVVAVMVNPGNPNTEADLVDLQNTAHRIGRRVLILSAGSERDIDAVIATAAEQAGAAIMGNDPSFVNWRSQIVAAAARHALPAVYTFREFTKAGGLMSYDTSIAEAYRQVGIYTGRILKGDNPADLPVQQVNKIELTINLKTAQALGIEIPPSVLARADEVIE